MPPKIMPKKERLTLSQLASYDDILTDALVDHVYFWTTIRKNRSKYNLTRGFSEDDITKILLYQVIVDKDTQEAEKQLLKLPGLRKFVEKLRTEREKEDFRRHMRKYINIWLPDCPWEVSTTNRYTIVTQEAAATARRFIKKGETIKYLCGNLVAITSEEEQDLDITRRDFSIVRSSRKKTQSLFLGPARFANHDCKPNARLVTRGSDGMEVIADRNIDIEEEINVSYGEEYFGKDNCECLCKTCEVERRNGWADANSSVFASGSSTPLPEEVESGPYSFRRKRKYGIASDVNSQSSTPDIEDRRPTKQLKIQQSRSPSVGGSNRKLSGLKRAVKGKPKLPTSSLRRESFSSDGPVSNTQAQFLLPTYHEPKTPITERLTCSREQGILASIEGEQFPSKPDLTPTLAKMAIPSIETRSDSLLPLAAEPPRTGTPTKLTVIGSFLRDQSDTNFSTPERLLSTPRKIKQESLQASQTASDIDSIFDHDQLNCSSPPSSVNVSLKDGVEGFGLLPEMEVEAALPQKLGEDKDDSELSGLSENEEFDDTNFEVVRKRKPRARKSAIAKTVAVSELETPKVRQPGDYLRTTLLLSEPYARWVDCHTCTTCWVQQNGYYTRKECPRCERHSKLYGFQWPKTDKVKGDGDSRVTDHRTVHRFLNPEEEAKVRKRGRGLIGEKVDEDDSEWEKVPEVMEGVKGRRSSKRRRVEG